MESHELSVVHLQFEPVHFLHRLKILPALLTYIYCEYDELLKFYLLQTAQPSGSVSATLSHSPASHSAGRFRLVNGIFLLNC